MIVGTDDVHWSKTLQVCSIEQNN